VTWLAHLPGVVHERGVIPTGALRNASIEPPAHVLEHNPHGVEKPGTFMNGQSVQSVGIWSGRSVNKASTRREDTGQR